MPSAALTIQHVDMDAFYASVEELVLQRYVAQFLRAVGFTPTVFERAQR